MTLKDIRSECSDTAGLLQPYVDGELPAEEQVRVGEHLEQCRPCRAAVQEQAWVRQTLRQLESEPAPKALRARILLDLDEVDRESAAQHVKQPGLWTRITGRARDLMRGGLVMVPAGAVAVALFFVAKQGFEPTQQIHSTGFGAATFQPADVPSKPKPDAVRALADVEPQVDFPIQMPPRHSSKVQLVGARLSEPAGNANRPGARLRYKVFAKGRDTGNHIVDWQLPASEGSSGAGTPVNFRGRRYLLDRAANGEPVVHFERRGVAHMLRLEGATGVPSKAVTPDGAPADFSVLLDLADQLHRTGG